MRYHADQMNPVRQPADSRGRGTSSGLRRRREPMISAATGHPPEVGSDRQHVRSVSFPSASAVLEWPAHRSSSRRKGGLSAYIDERCQFQYCVAASAAEARRLERKL